MAHEGHIIIKKGSGKTDINRFYSNFDRHDSKPACCYPKRRDDFAATVRRMERNLEKGMVPGDAIDGYTQKLKKHKDRLTQIDDSRVRADDIVKKDRDVLTKRYEELAEYITANTIPREIENDIRRVNPHTNLKKEMAGLGKFRKEYTILGRVLGLESNTDFLKRDK